MSETSADVAVGVGRCRSAGGLACWCIIFLGEVSVSVVGGVGVECVSAGDLVVCLLDADSGLVSVHVSVGDGRCGPVVVGVGWGSTFRQRVGKS